MNKSIISIMCLLIISVVLVGCDTRQQTYLEKKNVADVRLGETAAYEMRETEKNQKRLVESVPVPRLETSLERKNIARRLELLNDDKKIFYVYLISYGKVVSYHVAQGKVTSVSSYLTASEQFSTPTPSCTNLAECYSVIEAPDQDGSYGTNGDGIFFFTTEGAYVEWRGEYLVSDFPLKINTPTELVKSVQ